MYGYLLQSYSSNLESFQLSAKWLLRLNQKQLSLKAMARPRATAHPRAIACLKAAALT